MTTAAIKELIETSTSQSAIARLTQPVIEAISNGKPEDEVEERLWSLWRSFVGAAKDTSDRDVQNKLVEGLKAIQSLPQAKGKDGEQFSNWGGRVWDDLPILGAQLREEWNYSDTGDEKEREKWSNINAFVARLVLAGVGKDSGFELYAIWTLRDALESTEFKNGDAALNGHIPAAAKWIDIAGERLFKSNRDWTPTASNQGHPAKGGPLITDCKEGFSPERWRFWKNNFASVSGEKVTEKTKEIGRLTAAKMSEIEKGS